MNAVVAKQQAFYFDAEKVTYVNLKKHIGKISNTKECRPTYINCIAKNINIKNLHITLMLSESIRHDARLLIVDKPCDAPYHLGNILTQKR